MQQKWDAFVGGARNGHFFFRRDYLDYHSDRYQDASLVITANEKIISVLPANASDHVLYSHQGLTYGGFVVDYDMTGSLMMHIFEGLTEYLRGRGLQRLIYKATPYIYHLAPTEEDLYALHRMGARLVRRDLSSVFVLNGAARYTKGKRANLGKARKTGVVCKRSQDFKGFMALVKQVLHARHGTQPTHSVAEMELLAGRFPENIRLYCAHDAVQLLAGALVFINPTVVHTQYLACSDAGLDVGALDYLIDVMITREFASWRYLSFGVSTEDEGRALNKGLLHSKEAFGARGIVHDTYELSL